VALGGVAVMEARICSNLFFPPKTDATLNHMISSQPTIRNAKNVHVTALVNQATKETALVNQATKETLH
jgi:hypothetical protein